MRRLIFFIFLLQVSALVEAQTDRLTKTHEIHISVGLGGSLCCGKEHNDEHIVHMKDFEHWSPTLNLGYYNHLSSRWALGGKLSYMHWSDKCQNDSKPWNGISNDAEHNCYSIMPSVKYYWINHNHFGLYSSASFGLGFNNQRQKSNEAVSKIYIDPAWDVSFIGVEFGGSHIFGTISVNIGQATLLSTGISYCW